MAASHDAPMMTDQEWVALNRRATANVPRWEIPALLLVVLGVVGLLLGRGGGQRGLQAFWVNFLFWGGLAQGAVTFAAAVWLTRGQWGPSVARIALLQVAFAPVMLILFLIVIVPSSGSVVPWIAHGEELHGFKGWWLSRWFMLGRDFIGLALLTAFSLRFASVLMRPERGALAELRRITLPAGWRGLDVEREAARESAFRWAIAVVITYMIVYSLIGFDMVMSFEPHWYSTMFGGYFFVTAFYMALAALILWLTVLRRRLGLDTLIGPLQYRDVGSIMLGFCILSAYTCFAQYLPIWYGDLPEEVSYILNRMDHPVWVQLVKFVVFAGFVIPLVLLINLRLKKTPAAMCLLALLILSAGFVERNVLVLPPLFPDRGETFVGPSAVEALSGVLVTLGFAGLYVLAVLQGLRRGVIVPGPWRIRPFAY
jgi:Ni/Fe-hydrogenase subunit HybB-like protein